MGQSLLQTDSSVSKWGNFITKWSRYYKAGQVLLQSGAGIRAGNLLQSGSFATARWGRFYKVGQFYQNVEQILQSRGVRRSRIRQGGD